MEVSRYAAGRGNRGKGCLRGDRFQSGKYSHRLQSYIGKGKNCLTHGGEIHISKTDHTACFSFGDINCCRKKAIFTSVAQGGIALSIWHLPASYFNLGNDALLSHMPYGISEQHMQSIRSMKPCYQLYKIMLETLKINQCLKTFKRNQQQRPCARDWNTWSREDSAQEMVCCQSQTQTQPGFHSSWACVTFKTEGFLYPFKSSLTSFNFILHERYLPSKPPLVNP